jgi:thioredoxin 1
MPKPLQCASFMLIVLAVAILITQAGPALGQGFPPPPGKPAIIEFARPLCPICKEMEGILLEVKARYREQLEIRFAYIEPDEYLFRKFHIIIVPTQVFLDADGKEVYRNEGKFPKDRLINKLKELKFIKE